MPTSDINSRGLAVPFAAVISELGQVSTQRIDRGSALANKQITGPMDHQHALLLFGLDRNDSHSGPLNRLAACLGIGGIMLVVLTSART